MTSKSPPVLDIYYRPEIWDEPILLRPNRGDLVEMAPGRRNSEHVKRAVAWLAAYGQAHSWQLQEVLGVSPTVLSRTMKPLFESGIVARGRPDLFGGGSMPYFFKLVNEAPLKKFLRDMPTQEWLAISGGTNVVTGKHLKHNVTMGEVAIRAMRDIPSIACAFGEPFSAAERLVPDCKSGAIGDATLVRDDGLRYVVELTSYSTEGLEAKVVRWAKVLMRGSVHDVGLVIVFLNAAPPARHRYMDKMLRRTIESALNPQNLVDQHTPFVSDSTIQMLRDHILLASFSDWVKEGMVFTPEFQALHARALGGDGKWGPVDAIGMPFNPADRHTWLAPIRQMGNLYCIPRFMFEDDSEDGGGVQGESQPVEAAVPTGGDDAGPQSGGAGVSEAGGFGLADLAAMGDDEEGAEEEAQERSSGGSFFDLGAIAKL